MDKTDRLLNSMKSRTQEFTPIATDMFLPNLSGVSHNNELNNYVAEVTAGFSGNVNITSGYDSMDNMTYDNHMLTGVRYKKGTKVVAEITIHYDASFNADIITTVKDGKTYVSTFTYTYDENLDISSAVRVDTQL
jgi:hypothetical protein